MSYLRGMKQAPISGIYKILNRTTGDFYIGSSSNIRARWYNHKRVLKHNIGHNTHLQNAWNKYGESSFEFHVLEACSVSQLTIREQYYCDTLKPIYNKRKDCTNNTGAKLTRTPEANRKRQLESTLGRRVYQFDLEGNLLREFPSIREASRVVGKYVSQIIGVMRGERKSCGGFQWSYVNQADKYFKDNTSKIERIKRVNEERKLQKQLRGEDSKSRGSS